MTDEEVLRLDVAVHVAFAVGIGESAQSLFHDCLNLGVGKVLIPFLSFGDFLIQIALAIFKDYIDLIIGVNQLLDFYEIRRAVQLF